MKNLPLDRTSYDAPIHIGAGTDGLYSQEFFRDLLIHERKRAERSKRQILFVAVNIKGALTSTQADVRIVGAIIKSISKISREIDIKGWYEFPMSLGIIYTEISCSGQGHVLGKLREELASALSPEVASKIVITHTAYPEQDGSRWTNDPSADKVLYPPPLARDSWKRTQLWFKRVLDVVGSATGIVLFSPLFLLVAILIKATSRGPILFRQERIGFGGKRFTFLKFRSMRVNNDASSHREFVKRLIAGITPLDSEGKPAICKIQHDPRVTFIGRFLRSSSIDELPQLFNVLAGQMSLVGPRPPLDYEVVAYESWHRARVVEMKPGITGLWQVKGRSRTSFDGMVRMDLDYIRKWSLWLDVKLLFKTPGALVKGAY